MWVRSSRRKSGLNRGQSIAEVTDNKGRASRVNGMKNTEKEWPEDRGETGESSHRNHRTIA